MKLSGYQEEAVDRLVDNETFGCFDVPGSGKTAVAINACIEAARFPVLVTVPAHLVIQWRDEMVRWGVPAEEIAIAPRGCGVKKRMAALESGCAFTVLSYNSWASDRYRPYLLDRRRGSYVMDEAHRLRKGRPGKGGTWQGIHWLRTKTRSKHMHTPVWWLTGTPMVKDASDLFPLMSMVNPYRYRSRRDWATEMCHTADGPYGLIVGKVRDPQHFRDVIGKHSIRRTWRQIPELRKLQRRDIPLPIELEPSQLLRHRLIKQDYRDPETGEPLDSPSAMVRALRRISMPAKVEAATELLEDHPGRWLILAWYRDSARDLYDAMRQHRPVGHIDGTTPERERERAFATYRDNPNGVLVGTIGSLQEGLNLQCGYQVLFAEEHYLSTANEQSLRRVLRRGQTQPVLIYWMRGLKTYDMRVKRVSEGRAKDIETALDDFLEEEEWRI